MTNQPTQGLAAEIAALRHEVYALTNQLLALIDQLLQQGGATLEDAIESVKHIWAHAQVAGQIHGEHRQFAVFNALLDTLNQVEGDLPICRPAP